MLISNAIDQAISGNQFAALNERNVFVEEKYLECTDKPYVLGTIRHRVLDAGGKLVEARDAADVVMEVRSGGIGTDNTDRYVGVPGLAIPGVPLEIPEVRLWEKNSQFGTAKIAVTCFDTTNGQQIASTGNRLARSDNSRWSVLGFSTGDTGSVTRELAQVNYSGNNYAQPKTYAEPIESSYDELIARRPASLR